MHEKSDLKLLSLVWAILFVERPSVSQLDNV